MERRVDDKELRGALGGKHNLEPRGSPISGHRLPILLRRLQCGMLTLKCGPCTAVITVEPHMSLFLIPQYVLQYLRTSEFEKRLSLLRSELALEASVVLSGRVSENSCS